MLKVSYHGGHSGELCDHATDTKELVLHSYLDAGFTHVGITEHLPPTDDKFLYPDEIEKKHSASFLNKRFAKYFYEKVPILKEQFGGKAEFLFGFETEYYGKDPLGSLERAINNYVPEIIVASVHHVNDIPIDFSKSIYKQAVNEVGSLDKLYQKYYDQQLELISFFSQFTNEFPVVLGHMDLVKVFSVSNQPKATIVELIERNISEAINCGLVFEVNARAFKKGLEEPYPSLDIISKIKKLGGKLTLGDDSHGANQVGLHYDKLEGIVDSLAVVENGSDGYCWHICHCEREK